MLSTANATFFIVGFILYVAAMIVIGTIASKGKAEGKGYLTGGGEFPLFLIFATMAATLIGTGSAIGATANGFKGGFYGSAYGLGAALGLIVLWLITKDKDLHGKGFVTMAEEAQFYFNGDKHMKAVMSVMMYVIEVVWLGNHINGGATYLSYITGMDATVAKIVAVCGFGIYVIIGGLVAVIWTDLIQLIILLAGFVAILFISIPAAGGWSGISETLIANGKGGGLSFYGIENVGLMALVTLILSVGVPCLGTPTYRMRLYFSKDAKTGSKSLLMSAGLLFVFSFIPAIIGMAAFTIATNTGAQAVLDTPDYAFTYIATVALGPVLGLLFMIAGLSATMSSGDSDAIAAVTIFIQDVYPLFTGKKLEEEKVGKYSRIVTVLTLALAFFATLFAKDVMSYISNVIGSVIPGVSVAMLLGAKWKKATWQGGLASVIGGIVFGVLYLGVAPISDWVKTVFTGPIIPGTVLTLVLCVVVSLCTKNEVLTDEQKLQKVVEARG